MKNMQHLTYHHRLVKLGLESLEIRCIRADLVFAYKIIFGLADVNTENIFTVRASNSNKQTSYKLQPPFPWSWTLFTRTTV